MIKMTLFAVVLVLALATSVSTRSLAEVNTAHLSALDKQRIHNLSYAFKVCGYYCGPGWCSDQYIDEGACVATGTWGIPPESSEQCVDNCCRSHDYCCGSGNNLPTCNTAIVGCLDNYDCSGLCADAVWAAMKIVSEWCCGSGCPTYDGGKHFSPAGLSFCNKDINLNLTFGLSNVTASNLISKGTVKCDPAVPYSLNQTSNRIGFGPSNLPMSMRESSFAGLLSPISVAKIADHPDQVVQRVLLHDLMEGSKVWYMPNTRVLFVKIMRTKSYFNMDQC